MRKLILVSLIVLLALFLWMPYWATEKVIQDSSGQGNGDCSNGCPQPTATQKTKLRFGWGIHLIQDTLR